MGFTHALSLSDLFFHDFPAPIATKEGTAANLWMQEGFLEESQ